MELTNNIYLQELRYWEQFTKRSVIPNSNQSELYFEEEVLLSEKPVLVDFWASWCGPCKMLAPVLHEFADEHAELKVGKVNVDEEMDLAMRFGVSSIPTLILFKNGEAVKTTVGFLPKAQLESFAL